MKYDFSKLDEVLEADIKKVTDFINTFEIEVGVIEGDSKERKSDDMTNAELLYIHTFGSPAKHLPPRPVLDFVVNDYLAKDGPIEKTINKCIQHCLDYGYDESFIERELKILCQRMQRDARNVIYDGKRLTELSKNNPRLKKDPSAKPLLDTTQLARSIVARLVKKNGQ